MPNIQIQYTGGADETALETYMQSVTRNVNDTLSTPTNVLLPRIRVSMHVQNKTHCFVAGEQAFGADLAITIYAKPKAFERPEALHACARQLTVAAQRDLAVPPERVKVAFLVTDDLHNYTARPKES